MGQLKQLVGETAVYGISSVVGRLLNYLLVPLYTSVFAPGEYGVVTELYAFVAFLNVIYLLGMETAYFRFANKTPAAAQQYYSTGFSVVTLSALVFSGTLALFATPLVDFLNYPEQEKYIYWLSGIMAVDAIASIPFANLRINGKAWKFATIKLVNISANIGLNLFFLLIMPRLADNGSEFVSVDYVFLSNLLANALLIPMLIQEISKVTPRWNPDLAKEMMSYAWPLVLIGLAGVTNEMLSRAMLKYLLPESFYPNRTNLEALGIFGACYKLSVFMTLGIQAFRYAAEPFFFNQSNNPDSPKLFSNVMDKFVLFGAWVFVAISINLDLLSFLFLRTEVYREGIEVVPFLLLGGLFLGIYYNLSIWYKLTDKTIYGAAIATSGAMITVIFNIALIPILGYLGSAMVTLLTYFSMTTISYFLGQRYYPIPYKVGKALVHISLAIAFVVLYHYVSIDRLWLSLILRMSFLVGYGFVLYVLERKSFA